MSHDSHGECICVKDHNPEPQELNRHHIWPKAEGGPDEEWNLVWLCPTSHVNVHELLREYDRVDGEPSWLIRRHFNPYIRRLAARGWSFIAESRDLG